MGQAAKKDSSKNIINGVNVDELFGTIDAIKSAPVVGAFKFKATNK